MRPPLAFVWISLALSVLGTALGAAEPTITIKHDQKARYEIPERIKKIAVAEFGGKTAQDKQWGDIAADLLTSELDSINRQIKRYQLVDHKRLKAIMDAQDLQIMVSDAAGAAKLGKIAEVDAMIYGCVSVTSRDEQVQKTVPDLLRRSVKTVTQTKRYQMVSVSFTMDDIVTAKTLRTRTVTREYDSEEAAKKAGGLSGLAGKVGLGGKKAPPEEQTLRAMIHECVSEFVAEISPYHLSVQEQLEKGKSDFVKTGNKLAAAGDYKDALDAYCSGLKAKADDDGAMFNAGVVSEAMGDLKAALEFYDRAFKAKGKDKYVLARKRMKMLAGEPADSKAEQ